MKNQAWIQLKFLYYELSVLVNKRWWRLLSIWFSSASWVLIHYRLERFLYLLFGRAYGLLRIPLLPLIFLTQPWRGSCEIHYRADIGKGLKILHPELGAVVNAHTICGEHLTLTGGNCIGGRTSLQQGDIKLGNYVSLGANAVILGPITVGNNVSIGAGAVLIHDSSDNAVLVGVPAKPVKKLEMAEVSSLVATGD